MAHLDVLDQFDTTAVSQRNIDDGDVGPQFLDRLQRGVCVAWMAAVHQVWLAGYLLRQSFADNRVIVHQQAPPPVVGSFWLFSWHLLHVSLPLRDETVQVITVPPPSRGANSSSATMLR